MFTLCVSMQSSVLLPGDLLGGVIHLMFAYLLLLGKQCMLMVIMRSCLKIDQLPSFFLSFCLLDDLSGVASTNVCPCCCASCSPLPSFFHVSLLQWSSSLLFSSLADVVKPALWMLMGSFREVGKSPHWFLNSSRKLRSAWDEKCIVLCVFPCHSHAWWSPTCRTTSEKLK